MLVLRPVEQTDLPQLQQLARDSLVGVTSLPDDSERLRAKIAGSCASFASAAEANGPENYFFVLEDLDRQRLVGCSEILATAGFKEPFYSLRNRHFTNASRELNIEHGVPALSPTIARRIMEHFQRTGPVDSDAEALSARETEVLVLLSKGLRKAFGIKTTPVAWTEDRAPMPAMCGMPAHEHLASVEVLLMPRPEGRKATTAVLAAIPAHSSDSRAAGRIRRFMKGSLRHRRRDDRVPGLRPARSQGRRSG